TDYQLVKMKLDIEIKKLFQKEEQEIEKFKNRTLKQDNAIAEYLGIQYVELPNKAVNQMPTEKDMLLQLECGFYDYGMRELQEIIKINETTHLVERESTTDIEMLEKEKNMLTHEENKESYSIKVDSLTYDKVRENISTSKWAPQNKVKDISTNQTQYTQEANITTNQSHSKQKHTTIIMIWDLPDNTRVQKSEDAFTHMAVPQS
ncbi:19548_t:CDS:2, partial [Gigaspora rosea]